MFAYIYFFFWKDKQGPVSTGFLWQREMNYEVELYITFYCIASSTTWNFTILLFQRQNK